MVWDETGMRLGAVTMKDARALGVIDWPDGRYLLTGGPALRAVSLDGRVVFDWTVADMLVRQALPLSLQAGAPPAELPSSAAGAPASRRSSRISAARLCPSMCCMA